MTFDLHLQTRTRIPTAQKAMPKNAKKAEAINDGVINL